MGAREYSRGAHAFNRLFLDCEECVCGVGRMLPRIGSFRIGKSISKCPTVSEGTCGMFTKRHHRVLRRWSEASLSVGLRDPPIRVWQEPRARGAGDLCVE